VADVAAAPAAAPRRGVTVTTARSTARGAGAVPGPAGAATAGAARPSMVARVRRKKVGCAGAASAGRRVGAAPTVASAGESGAGRSTRARRCGGRVRVRGVTPEIEPLGAPCRLTAGRELVAGGLGAELPALPASTTRVGGRDAAIGDATPAAGGADARVGAAGAAGEGMGRGERSAPPEDTAGLSEGARATRLAGLARREGLAGGR